MILKSFWIGTSNWLRTHTPFDVIDHHPDIDDDGLLCAQPEAYVDDLPDASDPAPDQAIVKAKTPADKREPLEKLQAGFNQLIEQLEGINAHLGQQVSQHRTLVGHVEQLPEVLNSIPDLIKNQKQATEDLYELMRQTVAKDEQFVMSVERIPEETARQTQALRKIDERLEISAGLDVRLMDEVGQFNQTLGQLHTTAQDQTDQIRQMVRTMTDRDVCFRQMMCRQNRRLAWLFLAVAGLSVSCVALFAGAVLYLR